MLWKPVHAVAARLLLGSVALMAGGCSELVSRPDLNSSSPALRAEAIVQQTEYCLNQPDEDPDRKMLIIRLVGMLDDEDDAVRSYAITGLNKLTGKRFDYLAGAPLIHRNAAIARWREYLVEMGYKQPDVQEEES